jgi:Tol biopolymer transport system component
VFDRATRLRSLAALIVFAGIALGCESEVLPPPPPPDTAASPPQGGRIAFVSTRAGSPHIYVANGDGSSVTRLTSGEAPAWSWDGQRIAFHRGASSGGSSGIYVMNADGSNQRHLVLGFNPAWSPDGRIAFNTGVGAGGGIYVMNSDGSGQQLLRSDEWAEEQNTLPGYGVGSVFAPTWSPDGRRIAFTLASYWDGWRTYIMNADGSDPSPLPNGGYTSWEPAWSPDGLRVGVGTTRSNLGSVIASLGADGSGSQQIHHQGSGYLLDPDWSPDGRQLVFTGQSGNGSRIFAVAAEGGSVRQLIAEAVNPVVQNYRDYAPAWSRAP